MKVYIDTSAFIAVAYEKDARHAEALAKRDRCAARRDLLFTSDVIIYETLNWLTVRLGSRAAAEFGRSVWLQSPYFKVLAMDLEDRLSTLQLLTKFSQIPLSFADAASIHLIQRYRLDRAFSFDRHFVQANVAVL